MQEPFYDSTMTVFFDSKALDTSFYLVRTEFMTKISYARAGTTEALDGRAVRKISKRHFFQGIKNSFYGVTQTGLKPHQIFFQIFFSTNMVPGGV